MKSIFATLCLFASVSSSAFAQASAVDFRGTYGRENETGDVEKIARVYKARNLENLRIKFFGACIADLGEAEDGLTGSCAVGSGIEAMVYVANLKDIDGSPVLFWQIKEYGDDELGFSEVMEAFKIEE